MQNFIAANKKIALTCVALVLLLSLTILLVWQFDWIDIKNLFPSRQISNPITALCFLTSALSFRLLTETGREFHRAGKIFAFIVMAVGLIRFGETFLDTATGVDRWLFPGKLLLYGNGSKPNFMAPNTALAFSFLGGSLLSYRYKLTLRNKLCDGLAVVVLLLSFICMMGYLYNSGDFYIVQSFIPMAFPTAISFFVSALAILLYRSEFGLFAVFTAQYTGGRIARLLVPFAIAIPVVTGLLNLYGVQLQLYSPVFGVTLFSMLNILAFLVLIWRSSIYLNRYGREIASKDSQLQAFNRELEQKVEQRTAEVINSQRRFQSLIENSVDLVSIIGPDNRLNYISPSAERILGYKVADMLNSSPDSILHPDYIDLVTAVGKIIRKTPGTARIVRSPVRHHDGHYMWMEGTIANRLDDPNIAGIVCNFHDISEQLAAEEQARNLERQLVEEKFHQQKALIQAAIDGQEKEKKEIGMELHDHIAQILASATIYLSVAASRTDNKNEMIEKAKGQVTLAVSEIRKLSHALVPIGIGAGGIMEAITDVTETIQLLTDIKCQCNLSRSALERLNDKKRLAVYRIIQEQFNNILKHAHARNVYLAIILSGEQVILTIEDDGKGFDALTKPAGIGLSNIKTRVDLLLGDMKMESSPGKGCRLRISFPANQTNIQEKALITADLYPPLK